ncbi:ABC-2 type transport system ATP-binding protein [Marchantia polymorpha subsp. ruderalis]|uniref:ABC transporter domain-containing protein n=2 Tax=Marchantia polymorpha TaxID=3197 RepID=A0A176W2E6_MARPO|nr:hypothetical protein AXG93_793s1050 [Marchantia polymorpha subsp. ruderalis]PTQ34651.1 hypothetical protein MARPO_0078s0053 [Marchantia polymorpha]BBN10058.1 hypothetical protein Mp_5g00540 [Marchantia polymorpha subsp. ruderalis]|eukprot:PTQ34651.1 hypothetical protein MARPO_0078s0053 [Marchantia polymorpha]
MMKSTENSANVLQNGHGQQRSVPTKSSVPAFGTQANALLRKNLIFQMRNYKTNVCAIAFPVVICLLLFGLQAVINKVLDRPGLKCGCVDRINPQTGLSEQLCGLQYTTDPVQAAFCPVDHPPEWPALMQVPNPRRVVSDNPLGDFFRGTAILYTGQDPQTAQALMNQLIVNNIDVDTTDPLIKYSDVVVGSPTSLEDTLILEQAFIKDDLYVLQNSRCTNNEDFQLSLTYNLSGLIVPYNGTPRCITSLYPFSEDVTQINRDIYLAAQSRISAGDKKHNDFVTAYDFGDTSADKLNVSVFYNAYGASLPNTLPPRYHRVSRPMNLAAQAYLRFLTGAQAKLSVWFLKEMPRAASELRLDLTILLGPLFYMWVSALLFPVIMTTLVYEKQKNLRMMMKMHGLGDGAYWVITYAYFLALSLVYFFFFVALGSAVGLKFFRLNSYSMQFVFFFIYMNLQIALSFLVATIFQNTKTATVCGYMYVFGFGLMGQFFFRALLEDLQTGRGWIFGMELLPGFSLYRGLYEFGQYSLIGNFQGTEGMQWRDLKDKQNGLKTVFQIQAVEWIVFLAVTCYLDQVMASSGAGVKRHPLFCFGCSWNNRRKRRGASVNEEERALSKSKSQREREDLGLDMEKPDVAAERARVEQLRDMPSNTCAIVCDDLKKVYPGKDGNQDKYAVRGLSLGVETGECFGMLGPNGAGKSTTINMMIGLLTPSSGTAYIHGLDITRDMNRIYTSMGVCPQHDLIWEQLTGREHLLFYGRLKNLKGPALWNAVDASLKSVNLFDRGVGDKKTKEYSGGMKRRLSVAISLIGDPKVVYMDEPSTGLDPASRSNLWNIVKEAKKDRAIILTTHSMEEAEALCDRLCIFVNGQLQCIGDSKELTSRYGGVYVLTVTTPVEKEQEVIDLVETLSRHSQKIYGLAGTQKFELPKAEVQIARVFSTVERAKQRLRIQAWGISDTTLEDVFIKVAREAQQGDADWS